MKDVLLPVVVGFCGALLINMFYSVAKVRWPENYFTTTQILDQEISSSWLRYGVFRLLPPYVLGVLTGAVAIRYDVSIGWTLVMCGTAHLTLTIGRAVVAGLQGRTLSTRLVVAYVGIVVMTTLSIWGAGLTTHWWFPLTPGPDKYIEVALTGIVAAAVVHYLQRVTGQSADIDHLVASFKERLPPEIFNHLITECARHRVDHDLAYAILITEVTQRPNWIRFMERLGGRIGLSKTHGIMQSSRDRGVSDVTSISDALDNLSGAIIHRRNSIPRRAEVEYQLERHNKGHEFSEFAASVFWSLSNRYVGVSSYLGADGSPGLRVLDCRREGDQWTLTGDVSSEIGLVIVMGDVPKAYVVEVTSAQGENEYLRRKWSAKAPISLDSVNVVGIDIIHLVASTKQPDNDADAAAIAKMASCTVHVYLQ